MSIKLPPSDNVISEALPSNKSAINNESDIVSSSNSIQEKKVQEVINAGGVPTSVITKHKLIIKESNRIEGAIKNINIKFLATEGEIIEKLRDARPKIRNKKITISLHDWIIEAIQEKIKKEAKVYNIDIDGVL